MKKIVLAVLLLCACVAFAQQPTAPVNGGSNQPMNELFGGYTYLRTDYSDPLKTAHGFTGTYTVFGAPKFGITFMGTGEYGNEKFRNYGFGVGPRINLSNGHIQPFIHGLAGFDQSQFTTSIKQAKGTFAFWIGGGINLRSLRGHIGWRIIEADWERQWRGIGSSNPSDRIRLSTGINVQF